MSDLTEPATTGLEESTTTITRGRVFSWALWDWATQPFNSVILTFVFTPLYLTSESFLTPDVVALGEQDPAYEQGLAALSGGLGVATTVAGVLVALLAPVLGQRADVTGRRKVWLGGSTAALVVVMITLFAVRAEPAWFFVGAGLVALGTVINEIAGVNYNALMVQVATPRTVGRVSGLGWGMGYVGGIVALVLVVVSDGAGWFGLSTDDGLPYRVIALGCAVWTLLFAWPILRYVPELPAATDRPKVGFFEGYVVLWRDVKDLFRHARTTFWFLVASAVFRDGLSGVFTFGAVIAAVAFHFGSQEVVVFGIAANLVAGVSTMLAGTLDDRLGPRRVIIGSLVAMVVAGLAVVVLQDGGKTVFWVGGLILCCFVGPAQSASRSFLARLTPAGRESEMFGLYATTGRAASFLSPALWTFFIAVTGRTIWGTLGIVLVILAGLVLMLLVTRREPARAV